MKRTVDEKLAYNEKRETMFAFGYTVGVKNYRRYVKLDAAGRRDVDNTVRMAKEGLKKPGQAKDNIDMYKGILCGYRDAANERKERNKPNHL